MLLDLMGDSNMPATDASAVINGNQHNADLLADILGGGTSVSSPPPQTRSPPPQQSNMNSIMDLFDTPSQATTPQPQAPRPAPSNASNDLFSGMTSPPPQQAQQPSQASTVPVYNKNDLNITFQVQRSGQAVQVMARFRNDSMFETLNDLSLQAAVPKSQKLQLQAISTSELDGGQEATQQMRIVSVSGVSDRAFRSMRSC